MGARREGGGWWRITREGLNWRWLGYMWHTGSLVSPLTNHARNVRIRPRTRTHPHKPLSVPMAHRDNVGLTYEEGIDVHFFSHSIFLAETASGALMFFTCQMLQCLLAVDAQGIPGPRALRFLYFALAEVAPKRVLLPFTVARQATWVTQKEARVLHLLQHLVDDGLKRFLMPLFVSVLATFGIIATTHRTELKILHA
eukprot:965780-Prorocentrum_minimum.AAC.2